MKPRHDEKKETPFCLAVGECRRPSRSAYSALYWCEREGRIQSAERAVAHPQLLEQHEPSFSLTVRTPGAL
jgi:hypothetical protein